jgi:hypothetical protein
MWFLVPSRLLAGLSQPALFLVGVSYVRTAVRSWSFWRDPVVGPVWIGPRHTNYPDGSICAYEPSDSTWIFGNPLVELIDLYSVWALRHLHLRTFGRWPGAQAVHRPYERPLELNPEEHCGCGSQARSYAECCPPEDVAGDRIAMPSILCSGRGAHCAPLRELLSISRRANAGSTVLMSYSDPVTGTCAPRRCIRPSPVRCRCIV